MDIRQQLMEGGRRFGVTLTGDQIQAIERLLVDLGQFNEHTNLVSKADPQTLIADHVLDAFSLLPLMTESQSQTGKLIDIGSGAGFPGLILAIALPQSSVHLVDSIGKKTRFLEEETKTLGLEARVTVHTARAEQLAFDEKLRESFNLATARAVGSLSLVAELCLPFLTKGGILLAQKSRRQANDELKAGEKSIALLGGKKPEILPIAKDAIERDLVVIKIGKVKPTPPNYPRSTGQLRRPL